MAPLIDATSLLIRRNMPVMTGIDRVEYAIASWALEAWRLNELTPTFLINTRLVRGILLPRKMERLLAASRHVRSLESRPGPMLARLFTYLTPPSRLDSHEGAIRLQGAAVSKARPASWMTTIEGLFGRRIDSLSRSGAPLRYVHLSHYGLQWPERFDWILRNNIDATFFVHDLIPIDFPDYCSASAHQSHKRKLETIARIATRVAVNSEDTAYRLRTYLRSEGLRIPSIETIRLGNGPLRDPAPILPPSTAIQSSGLRPYYVCGGTLEGRKNIPLVIEAWRMLTNRRALKDMPCLVLAGERGWSAEGLFRDLDQMRDLSSLVIEVSGLNDAEMEILVDHAEAVITPSFAEGYSLVPAQAMGRGKMTFMSDIAAHRELASGQEELACFFDPRRPDELLELIERPRQVLNHAPVQRGWHDFAREILVGGGLSPPYSEAMESIQDAVR